MAVAIAALFAAGFALLALAPAGVRLSGDVFGFGTGILAVTIGARHAFDADHIAAIDNTTRRLLADGGRPLAVGFFFSLGHSAVVFALAATLGIGVRALGAQLGDGGSTLHAATQLVGTVVSGGFLYLIAILNLAVMPPIVRTLAAVRSRRLDESALERALNRRGIMSRLFARASARPRRSWHMFPMGALFGLGFDTATEVSLLVISGTAVVSGLPWWAVLALPLLFAGGMCLFDTIDGVLMNVVYGWAFLRPVRKVYYNVVITALSALLALIIGTIELLGLVAQRLGWNGRFWNELERLDLTAVGLIIAGLLVLTWGVALGVWKLGRFDERWEGGGAGGA
jgi:high-affinity nickel-transport protein